MVNFNNPLRWVILQYKACSGGKFLCACLMTIDRIAHWDPKVEHKDITYQQWVDTQWNHGVAEKWVAFEPMHIWNNHFFSRTFPRGNNISDQEYNLAMNQSASEYFKEIWNSNKLILDFNNKAYTPNWWRKSFIISLDADKGCNAHKHFLLKKLYPFDPVTKIGTVILDKGLDEQKLQNARVFKNQFEFGPFDNEDDWYDYIWKNDIRLNFQLDNVDIRLTDLLNYNSLLKHIQAISTKLDSNFNEDDLRYVYNYWIKKNII